jgi:ABC-type antimicrobial peptide transport system permease subunit
MAVRTRGDAATLGPRLRRIAADVDPGMNLDDVRTLDEGARLGDAAAMGGAGGIVAIVSLGLFLSASAVFALTSVTVSRRMREIGLRTALGASPWRVLTGIFSRAFALVGCGIAAGSAFLLLVVGFSSDAAASGRPGALTTALVDFSTWLAVAGIAMLVAGLVACIQPARRALRISPTEALRET